MSNGSIGKEYLKQLHAALAEFEGAVKQRENPGLLADRTALHQNVDKARERLVQTVVEIVTKDRLQKR
ncbi:MAG TPA: hypothetical protein VMH88_02335 [Gemmatimonadales bacterium]|nr:hypothetical protein [Gemmatimonadales bacterium]